MTDIYLVRHTQAEGNLYSMMQGFWDGRVTALGRQELELLRQRFGEVPVDAVYSSDLSRAVLTAEAIRGGRDIPLRLDRRLREIDLGPWETRFFADLMWECPEQIRSFMQDCENWSLPGAETYAAVRLRALEAMKEIAAQNEGKTIAVASHGVTIRCLLSGMLGLRLDEMQEVPIFSNTGIGHILYDNGRFTMDYYNDDRHLEPLQLPPWKGKRHLRSQLLDPRKEGDYYRACYRDAWRTAHGNEVGLDLNYLRMQAIRHREMDPAAVLRICHEEKSAGLLDMNPERGAEEGLGWISLLYLAPEYRGEGLGGQVLGRAVAYYSRLGRTRLGLNVSTDNTAALRFYRKWEFRETGSREQDGYAVLQMEKDIG